METTATLLQKVIMSIALISAMWCMVDMINKDIKRNRRDK